jgi:hypothetical protein
MRHNNISNITVFIRIERRLSKQTKQGNNDRVDDIEHLPQKTK